MSRLPDTLLTIASSPQYAHAAQVGWCSRNAGSVRTRTVSASLYNMFVQASAIIGANSTSSGNLLRSRANAGADGLHAVYHASDAPRYRKGNTVLLGITVLNLVVMYPGVGAYYKFQNRQKARKWNALSTAEKRHCEWSKSGKCLPLSSSADMSTSQTWRQRRTKVAVVLTSALHTRFRSRSPLCPLCLGRLDQ